MSDQASPDRIEWGKAIAWACFLSASWTWVIGMFLPVYLLMDFGVLGWVAFALVNVTGAALVGWVWRRPGDSERFVGRNESAMRLFSIATILFQFGFLSWFLMVQSLGSLSDYAFGAVAFGLAMVLSMLLGALGTRGWLRLAIIVMLASLAAIIATWLTSRGVGVRNPLDVMPRHGVIALALASPALALGFLLCPHLDLTIHRARQEAPGATGTAGFILGFGVLFLAMITFSLFYAAGAISRSWSVYVVAHIAIQACFTSGAHIRELIERGILFSRRLAPALDERSHQRRSAITAALTTLALIVVTLVGIAFAEGWINQWLTFGAVDVGVRQPDGSTETRRIGTAVRTFYQSALGLYALVFPAWLWIGVFMGDGLGRGARLALWLVALAIAGPLFTLGYMGERYALIPLAVGVVLAFGEVARRMGSRNPPS